MPASSVPCLGPHLGLGWALLANQRRVFPRLPHKYGATWAECHSWSPTPATLPSTWPRSTLLRGLAYDYVATATSLASGSLAFASQNFRGERGALLSERVASEDEWSPETRQLAEVAERFVQTFRMVARRGRLSWKSLSCDVFGAAERADNETSLTHILIQPKLVVPFGTNRRLAQQLLMLAQPGCTRDTAFAVTEEIAPRVVNERPLSR